MAYNLIGKNFTPGRRRRQGHRPRQICGRLPCRRHGVLQDADQPDPARPHPPHRHLGSAQDQGRARRSHRRRCAELPAAAAADPRQGRDASMSASRSSRSPPKPRRSRRRRSRRSRSTSSSCPMSPIRWRACSRAAPMRAPTAMSPAAQINLQTVKWDAGDFAAAGDDKMPLGKPAEDVELRRSRCRLQGRQGDHRGKLRLRQPIPITAWRRAPPSPIGRAASASCTAPTRATPRRCPTSPA